MTVVMFSVVTFPTVAAVGSSVGKMMTSGGDQVSVTTPPGALRKHIGQ